MPRPVSFEQQEIGAANIERFVDDVEAAAAAGNPIEIDRCRFTVAVDLTGLRATAGLRFTRCRFYQPVRLARTRIEGVLVLRGCYFRRGLDLSDARVEGPLDLGASWFRRPGLTPREDLVRYGLEDDYPAAAVYAVRLHVAGETMLKRAGSLGNVLFRQAELGKNFDATGIHLSGAIDLRAKVSGQVNFSQATVNAGESGKAVDLDAAEVGGGVFLRDGTVFRGRISALFARIGVGVFTQAIGTSMPPKNPGDRLSLAWTVLGDLDLSYARVAGPVQLCGVSLVGELLARHATIEGDLDLSGGVAGGGSATQRADILKSVMPEDRLLPRAQWTDAHRRHEPSPRSAQRQARQRDLDLRHATIKGHLGLHGQWVLGTVDLEDAHIGGEANFSHGMVRGDLMLRSATVVGRVFGNETDAAGPYPQVSGAIDARFAKLSEVDLCFSSPQQAADGSPTEVLLSGAKAELIRFRGGPVTREAGREADNRRSPLDLHNLEFKEIDADSYQSSQQPPPLSRWDLARAGLWIMLTAIALYLCRPRGDEGPYVPVVVGSLYAISAIWAWCAAKLRQRGKVSNLRGLLSDARFSPAFYAAVERWLRQAGRDVPADHVFLDRRRRETVHQPVIRVNDDGTVERGAREFSRVQQAYRRWGLDFCLGYGVRPARPLHVFLLLFLINWGMFLDGESVSRSTALVLPPVYLPRTIEAFENKTVKWPELSDSLSHPTPAEWTATAAGFIALRLQLPVIDLVAEGEWNPSGKPIAFTWPVSCRGLKYEDYAALMQVTNLVLLPLIIAGATGFLKQKS